MQKKGSTVGGALVKGGLWSLIAAGVYYEMRRKQQKQAAAARQSAQISSTYTGAAGL